MSPRKKSDAFDSFRERYAAPTADVNARIEHAVIGASWGANGFTAVNQADELAQRLRLRPDGLLLDVGAGRGWPGLYLAASSGCTLIGTDVPLEALDDGLLRRGLFPATRRVSTRAALTPSLVPTYNAPGGSIVPFGTRRDHDWVRWSGDRREVVVVCMPRGAASTCSSAARRSRMGGRAR